MIGCVRFADAGVCGVVVLGVVVAAVSEVLLQVLIWPNLVAGRRCLVVVARL